MNIYCHFPSNLCFFSFYFYIIIITYVQVFNKFKQEHSVEIIQDNNASLVTEPLFQSWKYHFESILNSWPNEPGVYTGIKVDTFRDYFKKFKGFFDQNKTKIYSIIFSDVLEKIYGLIFAQKETYSDTILKSVFYSVCMYLQYL